MIYRDYDYVCQKRVDVSVDLPQTNCMTKGICRQCWSIRLMAGLESGVCKFLTASSSEPRDVCEDRCRQMQPPIPLLLAGQIHVSSPCSTA